MAEFSTQQQRVIDHEWVTLEGIDEKGRPVVSAMVGIPQQLRQWALTRTGDPTDVTGDVRPVTEGST